MNGEMEIRIDYRPSDNAHPILLSFQMAGKIAEVFLSRADARLIAKALVSRAGSEKVRPWNHQVKQ